MAWAVVVVCRCPVYQNSAAADLSAAPAVDFVDSAVAGYSGPAADRGFAADCFVTVGSAVAVVVVAAAPAPADLCFAADRFVIAVAADPSPAGPGLSFGPFCSADFSAAVGAAVSDVSSAAQSFS